MSSTPRANVRRAVAAAALVVAGLLLLAISRILSGTERHAFDNGVVAPSAAHVTAGRTYTLSTPGGVKALQARRAAVTTPSCEWSVDGSARQALVVADAGVDTKAINVVATFVSPLTGDIHVDCLGWGPMFLDNADGRAGDPAGWLLLFATIALTIGVGLGLAALRSFGLDSERATGEDEEIERLVHAVHVGAEDREVGRGDGGDVVA